MLEQEMSPSLTQGAMQGSIDDLPTRPRYVQAVAMVATLMLGTLSEPRAAPTKYEPSRPIEARFDVEMTLTQGGVPVPFGTTVEIDTCVVSKGRNHVPLHWNESAHRKVEVQGRVVLRLGKEHRSESVEAIWIVVWFDDRSGVWPFRRMWSLPLQIPLRNPESSRVDLGEIRCEELPLVDAGWLLDAVGKPVRDGAIKIEGAEFFRGDLDSFNAVHWQVYRRLLRQVMELWAPNNVIDVYPQDPPSMFRGQMDLKVDTEGRFRLFRLPYVDTQLKLTSRSGNDVVRRLSEVDPTAIQRLACGTVRGRVKLPKSVNGQPMAFCMIGVMHSNPSAGTASRRAESRASPTDVRDSSRFGHYIHALVDEDNRFEFRNLPTGSISIDLIGSGAYLRNLGTFDVVSGTTTLIPN